jgi:hypothetical protein
MKRGNHQTRSPRNPARLSSAAGQSGAPPEWLAAVGLLTGAVELEAGADAVLQVGVGEVRGERVGGAPAGAVRRHEIVGRELGERVARRWDERLEQPGPLR